VGLLRFALRQQAAQMGNGAMSALGVVGADPQRRIWSVPVPSPYRSTEEMAQHNIAFQNEAAQQAGESADAASHTGSTPDGNLPKDKRDETPFDRVTPEASQHDLEYSQSDERTSENGSPEEPLWQKWLAKLRQLIGFE
jgi:hypothetical protein